MRVPGYQIKKLGKEKKTHHVPSTAMHSSKTCPDERAKGIGTSPLQAGHQSCRENPGLGDLLPRGTWSMIHWLSTLKKVIKEGIEKLIKVFGRQG